MVKSRLDQLWEQFKGMVVQTVPSSVPSDNVLLSESAIRKLIFQTSSGILQFEYREHPTNPDLMQLRGLGSEGYVITTVDIDKGITDIIQRTITQEDIDSGVEAEIDSPALELVYVGKTKVIPLPGSMDVELVDAKLDELRQEIQEQIDSLGGGIKSITMEGDSIVFVYNTEEGEATSTIDLSKYIDVYQAGDNITIENNVISAKVPTNISELTNDLEFQTKEEIDSEYAKKTDLVMTPEDKEKLDSIVVDNLITTDNIGEFATGYDDTEVKNRLDNLESIDHSQYLTQDDLDKELNGKEAMLHDIVLCDTEGQFISIPSNTLSNYDPAKYTPIGIVVIPASHDVYGTGEAGVMALMNGSNTTPDVGTTSTSTAVKWGPTVSISTLTQRLYVNVIGSSGTVSETVGVQENAQFPKDVEGEVANPQDPGTYYASSGLFYAPSPFNAEGGRNPLYYSTSASSMNGLSEFSGKENTEKILNKITTDAWKTAETIANQSNTFYPAAMVCWRFHTLGTNQGDWYLPSCGELGYMSVRQNTLSNIISSINTWAGSSVAAAFGTYQSYWSSTIADKSRARQSTSGFATTSTKTLDQYVRPFTRMSLSTPGLNDKLDDFVTKQELSDALSTLPTNEDLNNKVDKVEGKGLSTNDFTDEDKAKLDSLQSSIVVLTQEEFDALENKDSKTLYIVD